MIGLSVLLTFFFVKYVKSEQNVTMNNRDFTKTIRGAASQKRSNNNAWMSYHDNKNLDKSPVSLEEGAFIVDKTGKRNLNRGLNGYVLLCKHDNCKGGSFRATPNYYVAMPDEIGNDELSYVFVAPRVRFIYYEHSDYLGWRKQLYGGKKGLHFYFTKDNDKISSFEVRGY
jgi:hypothetical protein